MEERYPEKVRRRGFDSHRDHCEMGALFLAPFINAPMVYWLRRDPFKVQNGVRFPVGVLPLSLAEFRIPI